MRRWLFVTAGLAIAAPTSCALLLDPDDYLDPRPDAGVGGGAHGGAGGGGAAADGGGGSGGAAGGLPCVSDALAMSVTAAHQIGADPDAISALDVAGDSQGNVYLLATCLGLPRLDGMSDFLDCTSVNSHYLVVKVDASGQLAWATPVSGVAFGTKAAIAASDADVWIAGGFINSVGVGNCSPLSSTSFLDAFAARLDAMTGECTWARTWGENAGDDYVTDIAPLANAEVAIVGRFNGTLVMGVTDPMIAGVDSETFVARLDADGEPSWSKALGGGVATTNARIAFRGGHLVVAGTFVGTLTSCTAPAIDAGFGDLFVASLDPMSGAIGACTLVGGHGDEELLDVDVDGNGAPTLLATFASSSLGLGAAVSSKGGKEVLVLGLDPDMSVRFALDQDGNASAGGLALDPATGDATFAVASSAPVGGSPGFGQLDVYAGRVSCSGFPRWNGAYGSPGDQGAVAVAGAPLGELVIAGTFDGEVAFVDRMPTMLANSGTDAFVARLTLP